MEGPQLAKSPMTQSLRKTLQADFEAFVINLGSLMNQLYMYIHAVYSASNSTRPLTSPAHGHTSTLEVCRYIVGDV